ncbi:hypothetical protein B0H13DRAFT_2078914 [Mycena leptocephala]|nr:hypothetical protein B0H13DRAFT_2078914 [Mycena leptocephala]
MTERTGILDLPTEILVKILEDYMVPNNTLYALGVLCRRLHFISLPIYFSRHGITATSKSLDIDMRTDRRVLLAVLLMALFTPPIENITCIFPHPDCTSIFPILLHLKRLQDYITRLPAVKHVTLQLDERGSMCLSVGDDSSLQAWTSHLEGLLNCIVRKKCTRLSIMYGAQFIRAYEPVPVAAWQGRLKALTSIFSKLFSPRRSETHQFRRVPSQGRKGTEMTLPSSAYQSCELTSLEIYSPILVLPPGLLWTLTALRNCPITSLTLELRLGVAIPWSTVLPLIASAARGLTTLVVQEAESLFARDGTETNILDFISQFPLLRHLTISCIAVRPTRPLSQFGELETIRAVPPLIHDLLRNPSHLPKIQGICILWREGYIEQALNFLATALSVVLQRPEPPHLSFSLSAGTYCPAFSHPTSDVAVLLNHIVAVEIDAPRFHFSSVDVREIALWVALFPRVRRVDITVLDWKIPAIRDNISGLIEAVRPTECLKKIHLNGEAFDLVMG